MSTELIKARTKLNSVNRYVKQDKLLPAIISIHDALKLILSTPLLKHEKKEFANTLDKVLFQLNKDDGFRKVCPLKLEYEEGKEKELLEALHTVLEDLQGEATDQARQMLQALEDYKSGLMERARNLMERGKFKDAKTIYKRLMLENPDDTDLKVEIGEEFLKHGRYQDALDFFNEALKDFPENVHLYNRIAIALRKLERYDDAESYYKQALRYVKTDAGLLFNMGRMYIDTKNWKKAYVVAKKALELDPDFDHARKMLTFATKKIKAEAKACKA